MTDSRRNWCIVSLPTELPSKANFPDGELHPRKTHLVKVQAHVSWLHCTTLQNSISAVQQSRSFCACFSAQHLFVFEWSDGRVEHSQCPKKLLHCPWCFHLTHKWSTRPLHLCFTLSLIALSKKDSGRIGKSVGVMTRNFDT